MSGSLYFHNLKPQELDLFLEIVKNPDQIKLEDIEQTYGSGARELVVSLVAKGFLGKTSDTIHVLPARGLISHFLKQEARYAMKQATSEIDTSYMSELKNYLANAQKQIIHVETESRKSFLNLRTMIDKISDQGKQLLNIAFEKALDRNTETGAWVTIPHVSPVGLYEPIEDLKGKFKIIIDELERSLANLMTEYSTFVNFELSLVVTEYRQVTESNNLEDILEQTIENMDSKKAELLGETRKFNEEVLIALNEQINLLERNLGKDLMEQFDAIERLNDLRPERVWIMLEEARSELIMYLNSIYSRILREVNTVQLQLDFSKTSLILTNEAAKVVKRIDKLQEDVVQNILPLNEIIEELDDEN